MAISRRKMIGLLLALSLLPAAQLHAAGPADSLEYAIKATFLLKFPAFVTWPRPLPPDSFNVCVIGDDPFSGLLRQAAAEQIVEQRRVAVRLMQAAVAGAGCQEMFVAHAEPEAVARALAAVRGAPVLTVTDGEQDAAAKGIINFIIADGRVRFEIDLAAAAASGIGISSKLLSVASSVHRTAER